MLRRTIYQMITLGDHWRGQQITFGGHAEPAAARGKGAVSTGWAPAPKPGPGAIQSPDKRTERFIVRFLLD
jgi:hypothetical protein